MRKNLFVKSFILLSLLLGLNLSGYSQCQGPWCPGPIPTAGNQTVLVQPTLVATYDGIPIDTGNWIGAFFTNSASELQIGSGSPFIGGMKWEGASDALTLWEEDVMDDGFTANEEIIWKIWFKADSSECIADVTYAPIGGLFNAQGNYISNTYSSLLSIACFSSFDVGISSTASVVSPTSGCGLTNETFSFYITNYGGDADSIGVSYSIDGGLSWINEAHLTNIPSGDSVLYIFSQLADISIIDSTYNCLISVFVNEDIDGSNDTIEFFVENNTLPDISFTGLDSSYCFYINQPAIPLQGYINGVPTNLGTFDSPYVFSLQGDFLFVIGQPLGAPVGTHIVKIDYEDNNGCIGSFSDTTTIYTVPYADFSGLPSEMCCYEEVCLATFPQGGYFVGFNPPHFDSLTNCLSPLIAGTYSGYYVYEDIHGCIDTSSTQTVTAYELPSVSYTGLGTAYCIDGDTASLTGTPTGGEFYGAGISDSLFMPAAAGVSPPGGHNIYYKYVDQNGCVDSTNYYVNVQPLPTVSFTGLETEYCALDDTSELFGTPPGGIFTGATDTSLYFPAEMGLYDITYTYTQLYTYIDTVIACINHETQSTTVFPLPEINLGLSQDTLPNGNIETALPDTVVLTPGSGFIEYLWQDGSTSSSLNVPMYGEYCVTVINFNSCQNSDCIFVGGTDLKLFALISPSDSCTLSNEEEIIVQIDNVGTRMFSQSDLIPIFSQFESQPVKSEVIVLQNNFYPGESIYHTFGEKVDLSAVGSYHFRLFLDYVGGGTSNLLPDVNTSNDTLIIDVLNAGLPIVDLPEAIETNDYDTVVLDAGDGFFSYIWSTGETNQTIIPTAWRMYKVTVTDTYGCPASDSVDVFTGIEEIDDDFGLIQIYPNPNNGEFNIYIENNRSIEFSIQILNMHGQTVLSKNYFDRNAILDKIDIKTFAKGIYTFRLISENSIKTKKIILK